MSSSANEPNINVNSVIENGIDILKSEFNDKIKSLTEENINLKTQQEVKDKEYTERLKALEENANNLSFVNINNKFSSNKFVDFAKSFVRTGNQNTAQNLLKKYEDTYIKSGPLGIQSNVADSVGILCPSELETEIYNAIYKYDDQYSILNMPTIKPSNSKSIDYNIATQGVMADWIDEMDSAIFSKPRFAKGTIIPRKLVSAFEYSWESERFSYIDIVNEIIKLVGDGIKNLLLWELFHGDNSNGGMEGILRNKDILTTSSTVSKSFNLKDLRLMRARMRYGNNFTYIMHRATFDWLTTLTDKTDNFYNLPNVNNSPIAMYNGIPIKFVTDLEVSTNKISGLPYELIGGLKFGETTLASLLTPPNLDTPDTPFKAGDVPVILTDLKSTYRIAPVDGMRIDSERKPLFDYSNYFFHQFVGGKVIEPRGTLKLVIKA